MVTFAVAAFNVAEYIEACLDSIRSQSDAEFEILVVDDGSTDGTGRICDEYAAKDSRIRVIHKQNGGIASVRNLAIDEARGDWISFVDGDDLLARGAYDTLMQNLDNKFDAVYFDRQSFIVEYSIDDYNRCCEPLVLDKNDVKTLRLDTLYAKPGMRNYVNEGLRSVWAKAFRVGFLRENRLSFDISIGYAEDVLFNIDCLEICSSIKLVRRPFYLYRIRQGSAMNGYNPDIFRKMSSFAESMNSRVAMDAELRQRFYMDCITEMLIICMLDMCHRDNPKPMAQREKEYREMIEADWCSCALSAVEPSALKDKERKIYDAIQHGSFADVCRIFRKKDRIETLKRVLYKIGAARILKRLRNRFTYRS